MNMPDTRYVACGTSVTAALHEAAEPSNGLSESATNAKRREDEPAIAAHD
jgi:hypothetical protein